MDKPPKPVVIREVQGVFRTRECRGFSEAELKEAEISAANARKLSIKVDPRRHTKLDENVEALRVSLGNRQKRRIRRRKRSEKRAP